MRFKALKKIRHLIRDVIVMTGTPSPQGMMDLWSQIYLVDKGERLGRNITAFRSRYFDTDYMGYNYTIKPGAADNIRQRISDIAISMDAAEFIDLPPRLDVIRRVDIGKKASEIYAELRDEFLTIINGDNVEALSAATVANKLLQCCNGAVYTDDGHAVLHSAKLDELADILDDHGGEPVLVAYNFKTDLLRLKERFPFAVELDKDPRTIERWNKGEIRLLLAQPASCGHGLNLQAGGSICVWYGLNWSLELYEQFNARLHRQGQSKPVTVCHIVAGGCIDEKVLSVINGKAKSQRDLIDALRYQI
jgi:SNF2 family DNA or RNA helicase